MNTGGLSPFDPLSPKISLAGEPDGDLRDGGTLDVRAAAGELQVAQAEGRLHVEEVPKNRIYRVYQPAGSPTAICQEDEAMAQKFGGRIDAAMDRLREKLAAKGLTINTLYVDGEVHCSSNNGGPDEVVWLEVEDTDLRDIRAAFVEGGWKPEHWMARSAFIKGSNNGVVPFQKTTARLDKNKDKLKLALLNRLDDDQRAAAGARIARWHQFKEFYPDQIRQRKEHYQARLEELREQPDSQQQREFIYRMMTYFDKALAKFEEIDSDVIELALISPINGNDLEAGLIEVGQIFTALSDTLQAEEGPKTEGMLTSLSAFIPDKIGGDKVASGRNNDLTKEEAQWIGELILLMTHSDDIGKERALYDGARRSIETGLAPMALFSEDRMKLGAEKLSKMAGEMPRIQATQDTLESALLKFLILGPDSGVMDHPNFKVLWDGLPAGGNLLQAVIPNDESRVLRDAIVEWHDDLVPIAARAEFGVADHDFQDDEVAADRPAPGVWHQA